MDISFTRQEFQDLLLESEVFRNKIIDIVSVNQANVLTVDQIIAMMKQHEDYEPRKIPRIKALREISRHNDAIINSVCDEIGSTPDPALNCLGLVDSKRFVERFEYKF